MTLPCATLRIAAYSRPSHHRYSTTLLARDETLQNKQVSSLLSVKISGFCDIIDSRKVNYDQTDKARRLST